MSKNDKTTVLYSWLGNGDIRHTKRSSTLSGALFQAIESINPNRVCLLNGQDYSGNFSEKAVGEYLQRLETRLGEKLQVKRVENFNPINYEDICRHVIPFLSEHYNPDADTYFLQTSGTPSTAVVWILLAQTAYPARLIQTSEEKNPEVIELPFRIVADFIPSAEDAVIQRMVKGESGDSEIIHECETMKRVLGQVDRIAIHNVPVLLLGETGTGKELFANRIHKKSGREGTLIPINCGAISENLAESEFFGHKKGAFTGADKERKGAFEEANGGTLFLDEVGELPPAIQVKLLRALQEKVVVPVGGTTEVKVDEVRVVAATHRNLMEDVAAGRFREDLFYRLAVGIVKIPPLRDRDRDALLIAEWMLEQINRECAEISYYKRKQLDQSAKKVIAEGQWLGNVRELDNTIRRACIWTDHAVLSAKDIAANILEVPIISDQGDIMKRPMGKGFDIKELKKELQEHYLEQAYEKVGDAPQKIADLVGLSRNAVGTWLKENKRNS